MKLKVCLLIDFKLQMVYKSNYYNYILHKNKLRTITTVYKQHTLHYNLSETSRIEIYLNIELNLFFTLPNQNLLKKLNYFNNTCCFFPVLV